MEEGGTTRDKESYMFTTTGEDLAPTISRDEYERSGQCEELSKLYESMLGRRRHNWTTHVGLLEKLGSGGQGVVYLTERRGADGFTLPVALKIFSPERYVSLEDYESDMQRQAKVAARVARIQHENLLLVENFLDLDGIRMMVMEWVEGFDIRRLLTPKMLGTIKERFSVKRWNHINETLVTAGPEQPRFKTGVAIAIVSECLEGLAAMHRHGVVHADVKPANIMLKSSGHPKLIDIGSAFELNAATTKRACTPAYAAPEVLEGREITPQSDLASVGYVVVELLAGRPIFGDTRELDDLIEAKYSLLERLEEMMPEDVVRNDLLMSFCRRLVTPDPELRFATAEAANLQTDGATAILSQLVKGDMAMQYQNDIRLWIEELLEIKQQTQAQS